MIFEIHLFIFRQDSSVSGKTWIFNPTDNFKISEGPELNVPRMEFACGKLEIGGKMLIIIAGGWTGNSGLNSVELLDPTSNHGWFFGMNCRKGIVIYIIMRFGWPTLLKIYR